jgi:hypothetical protein
VSNNSTTFSQTGKRDKVDFCKVIPNESLFFLQFNTKSKECVTNLKRMGMADMAGYVRHGTVWMVGVNIYPKENDLPLLFAPTNICPLGCLDGGVNVDVDERERDPPQICSNLLPFRGKWN